MAEIPEISKDQWALELTPAKHQRGFYICPFCGSGTGPKGTAAFSFRDQRHGHCFSCNFDGDRYDAELKFMGIEPSRATKEEKGEAVRRVMARYGFRPSTGSDRPAAAPAAPRTERKEQDFSEYLKACHARLKDSPAAEYLRRRCITDQSMDRFNLGYGSDLMNRPCLVMPHNTRGTYYTTRCLDDNAEPKYLKPKDVNSVLFNESAIYQQGPCFVVESQLCAISIMQEGGSAVALASTAGKSLLLRAVKERKPEAILLLALDNDGPGEKAQQEIAGDLKELKIPFLELNHFIAAADCKDPNELLQKDPAALRGMISAGNELAEAYAADLKEKAIKEEEERQYRTGAGMIDSFLADVQTRMYEPLPTGITDIDNALDGGFMRQQLICLGAAPGAGKTALAQWIFEGMAEKGVSCVFLNLEMSRNQILARSISRYAARKGKKISNVKALRGYDWTEDQRETIMEAAEEYKRTVAPRMIYNPDEVTSNLDSILAYIESEAARAEAQGNPAPCVVLDYLQIVTGREREDGTELIKRAVFNLKRFAVEHNTVVFLIIAHNRDSNKTGTVTMESGRDTSAIEYSGDTQIGLTFTRCIKGWKDEYGTIHDKGKNPDDLTQEERKEITLKIVKSRFGGQGRRVDLRFNGETMTYTQLCKEFEPVDVETPFDGDEGRNVIKTSRRK